jgi:hypothetical protein
MGTTALDRPPAAVRTGAVGRPYLVDVGVVLLFLAVAAWLGHGLWPDPAIRQLALNPNDQILIEWFLAVGTQLPEHGLLTDRLNAPDGVNLLANASSPALGLLLAPVTLALGAPVSFALLTTGSLAATAIAWYALFRRTLGAHRVAAAVGGGFAGFAPAMVSQSNAHWHMAAQWLVPAIVWCVVRLAQAADQRGHVLPLAVCLAGLVTVQYFVGAEVLYLTAVTLAIFSIGYAALRPRWAAQVLPRFGVGLAVTAGVAGFLLAYPLALQFAGPGSVPNGPFSPNYFSADLASWPAFSPLSLAGSEASGELATGPAEYNTFLGWPLLLVAAGCVWWLRRHRMVVAAAITALVMAVLSLGPTLVANRTSTGFPLPYRLLVGAPVIDGALPQRYAMAVVPLVAVVLVYALDRAIRDRRAWPVPVAVGLALLPLLPTPLPTEDRPPVPAFVSEGHWRGCRTLVPVPLPTPSRPEPMRWAAAANAEFALPQGFFIGPYGPGGRAAVGTSTRPTPRLLATVAATGEVPEIGARHRAQAAADLAHWGADCVVLGPGQRYERSLRSTLEQLLGPGDRVADAWLWRVSASPG